MLLYPHEHSCFSVSVCRGVTVLFHLDPSSLTTCWCGNKQPCNQGSHHICECHLKIILQLFMMLWCQCRLVLTNAAGKYCRLDLISPAFHVLCLQKFLLVYCQCDDVWLMRLKRSLCIICNNSFLFEFGLHLLILNGQCLQSIPAMSNCLKDT